MLTHKRNLSPVLNRGTMMSAAGVASAMTLATATVAAPPAMTDQSISDAVSDELLIDASVLSHKITVLTNDGIVRLSGSVNNALAKQRAERIAETIRGVRDVINMIEVKPLQERSSAQVRSDVESALLANPTAEALEITASVNDRGEVTLTGQVDSWQERMTAENVAKGVAGVTGVVNDINVSYALNRSDAEIRTDVKSALQWDVMVDDGLVDIAVADGEVALSGVVGSAAEKRRATQEAWVAGVTNVNVSELRVERWARDNDLRAGKYQPKPDDEVRRAVETQLLYEPLVLGAEVKTEVEEGVVTLRGTLDSLMSRRIAERTAREVVGVKRVVNRITVEPEVDRTDAEITSAVESALQRSPDVNRYEIFTSVNDDIVTLTGTVDTWFEKARADDVVAGVPGVVAVNNNLDVQNVADPLLYDPYVYEFDPVMFDWYGFVTPMPAKPDGEIAEDINNQLWWSPFVGADEVNVTVIDGVATLTGTVDSLSESRAATENAYEGGAVWVRNKLEVESN